MKIRISYFLQTLFMTWGCAMFFTKGHLGKVNDNGRKSAKFVSGPFFWIDKHLFLFRTNIVYDLFTLLLFMT